MATVAEMMPGKRQVATKVKEESQFTVVAKRFMRHRLAVLSLLLIILMFTLSLLAPVITTFPRDATDVTTNARPAPPGTTDSAGHMHLLGVDNIGRDLFTRVLYAGRISLSIALSVVLISEVLGVIIGAAAGYYGGWFDSLISRLIEFLLAVPLLPILLIVSALMMKYDEPLPLPRFMIDAIGAILLASDKESQKVIILVLILVAFGWLGGARLMRGMALSLRSQDFVESLRAVGANDARIIFRHIIPNGIAPILVNASLDLGGVILLEAALSFLGLGIQDPTPTWGNMMAASQSYMFQHPWLPLIPGIPLVLVALSFNFIGDGLRDALDPRLKR